MYDKKIHKEHHHKRFVHKRKRLTLRRDLGLLEATSCGVGIISGAGIYVLIGAAAGMAGNAIWLAFLISAFIAVLSGLSYAELSSVFPKDAGEYIYAEHAFGRKLAFIVGWLILSSGVIAITTIALGFAGYFKALLGGNMIVIALAVIALLAIINYIGVRESTKLNIIFTIIEVGGLLLIIFIGMPYWGSVNYLEMPHGTSGLYSAAALIFFAFIGFESIVKLSEETKNPQKIIPKSLLLSLAITSVLYLLVSISAVSVINWAQLGASSAPLADVAFAVLGSKVFILLSVIALFSTFNTILVSLLSTSRIAYGMGVSKSLPSSLGLIHPKQKTPWVAILVVSVLSGVLVFGKDIALIAEMTNLTIFLTFIFVNLALIVLRFKEPDHPRPFKVPLNFGRFPALPLVAILLCGFMISNLNYMIIIGGVILLLFGVVFYHWYDLLKHFEVKIMYRKKV